MKQVHVVYNELSGASGLAKRLLNSHVLPALKKAYDEVVQHATQSQGDGQRIGKQIRDATRDAGEIYNLVLLGGDGTTGEVINGLFESPSSEQGPESKWKAATVATRIALVPTGTANALYAALYASDTSNKDDDEDAWRLKSLKALLRADEASLHPLTLSGVCVQLPTSGYSHTLAHIVTSQALHAAILRDSEELRASHPGVERFRLAAAQNSIVWHTGELILLGDNVSAYDPSSHGFVSLKSSRTLQGPFVYIAALSQDRLEPTFIPAPFAKVAAKDASAPLARPQDQLDVVIVRPLRDPNVRAAIGRANLEKSSIVPQHIREAFAQGALASITKGMYDGGKHVNLRYPVKEMGAKVATDGTEVTSEAQGETAIEYYRAQGYAWSTELSDSDSGLTCIDGALVSGVKTEVRALGEGEGSHAVRVWR